MADSERRDDNRHDALFSVYDKGSVAEFAQELQRLGNFRLISTGGTAEMLKGAGLEVTLVEDITQFPSMLGGRVKTLHPNIHGGILADLSKPDHLAEMRDYGITPIDVVVVDLYPFGKTVAREGVTKEEAVEQIDIGGVALLRAAAKNHDRVVTLFDKGDYPRVIEEYRSNGKVSDKLRLELAAKAYDYTSQYDGAISDYLADPDQKEFFPHTLRLVANEIGIPRYGENPHQKAKIYSLGTDDPLALDRFAVLQGKEMSYNNFLDLEAAVNTLAFLGGNQPSAVVIKHTNPAGAAFGSTVDEAFEKAWKGDSLAAFGGIVGVNRTVDLVLAQQLQRKFIEVLVAPGISDEAKEVLQEKSDMRILVNSALANPAPSVGWDIKKLRGIVLVQEPDLALITPDNWQLVTDTALNPEEIADLLFAWQICRVSKSNTITIARNQMLVGSGVGQQDRKRCCELAVGKAIDPQTGENRATDSVAASDAFFPFPDGPEILINAGVRAIIQPGGSKRDQETIDLCNKHGVSMVYTGIRGFKH